jgi:hypothetical protein
MKIYMLLIRCPINREIRVYIENPMLEGQFQITEMGGKLQPK